MEIDMEYTPIVETLIIQDDKRTQAERLARLEADAHIMQEDIAWLQKKVEELAAQLDFVRGKQRLHHGRLLKIEGAKPDSHQVS